MLHTEIHVRFNNIYKENLYYLGKHKHGYRANEFLVCELHTGGTYIK